jgi:hypothetical protein
VNVHISNGKSQIARGRLNPDTRQIEWTEGQPSAKIQERAQEWLLTRGKYDIARAKKGMSILRTGEGEEGKPGGGKLGEGANFALGAAMFADLVTEAVRQYRVNKMEGVTGFHLNIAGKVIVTNLQKFGETVGAGAAVSLGGQTFYLQKNGNWVSPNGDTLTQGDDGNFFIDGHAPTSGGNQA